MYLISVQLIILLLSSRFQICIVKYACRTKAVLFQLGLTLYRYTCVYAFTKIESRYIVIIMIGEIYRVPGTGAQLSMQRYRSILQIASAFNGDVMIGSDQNFNYANVVGRLDQSTQ